MPRAACRGGSCGMSGTVFACEVSMRLHFDEAARGALELEVQPLAQINRGRRGGRRHHDLDAAIVEFVDQHDEAPRRVLIRAMEYGDVLEEDGVVQACEFDVIILTARSFAKFAESEPRRAGPRVYGAQRAPLDDEGGGPGARAADAGGTANTGG